MKYKKKIDDIYREGLLHAETPPPADSWEIISSRLPREKREKVLPLWMKWSGVAAAFALLLMVFNFGIFETPQHLPVATEEEHHKTQSSPASEISPGVETRISDTQGLEQQENDLSGSSSSQKPASEAPISEGIAVQNKNAGSVLSPSEDLRKEVTAMAEISEKENVSEERILSEAKEPAGALAEAPIVPKKSLEATSLKEPITEELLREEAAIAEAEPEVTVPGNENFLKRFRISTAAGAVYFNMPGSNTVDEQFADNGGGSKVTMAYGVNLAYQLSEKFKLRSGVNKFNFNYSTRQVDYSAAMSSGAVKSDPAGMGVLLSAQGDLDQEFGFIEIPLEVEFTLIDKKIGLNLIGGASTLVLEENNLAMTTPAFTTDLGEAQNINDLSFSANLGLGVHYMFAPKIRLNLEPMFKYQLHTFEHSNSYTFGIYSGLSYNF